jgi:hypothetical protein
MEDYPHCIHDYVFAKQVSARPTAMGLTGPKAGSDDKGAGFLSSFITLISCFCSHFSFFCNFLQMVMCQMEIGGYKTAFLHMVRT